MIKSTCLALIALALALGAQATVAQTTFVVNSLGDAGQEAASSGVLCFTGNSLPPQIPECTLRAAIQSANAASGSVTIQFWSGIATESNGHSLIDVSTALPFISNQVTIDGHTHPGFQGDGDVSVWIRYQGTGSVSGIRFASNGSGSGSTVRGLGILSFTGSGILLGGGGGYTIVGNHLGHAWHNSATAPGRLGNHGIDVNGASDADTGITIIRDNVIASCNGDGIHIRNGANGTFVQDNVIGLPRFPNGFHPFDAWAIMGAGVHVAASAGEGNFIGGFGSNVISNNQGGGVVVRADAQTITGNLIGLPPNFEVHPDYELEDYGNGATAVVLESSGNTIGGTGVAVNHIGNSPSTNIRVGNGSTANPIVANDNQIRGNNIGFMPDGDNVGTATGIRIDNGNGTVIDRATVANHVECVRLRGNNNIVTRSTFRGCTSDGIRVMGGATIGGTPAQGNRFYNSVRGVYVVDNGNRLVGIHGNWFGTDADGTDLGNTFGVQVATPNNSVDIGRAGDGNVFGHNSVGISLIGGATNTWIFSNRVGILPDGTPAPNRRGIGINPTNALTVSGHLVGTSTTSAYLPELTNVIAFNEESGVDVRPLNDGETVINNSIRGNRFFGNGKGIDLGPGGDTVDPGGGAEGPNRLQNFPEIDPELTFYDPATGQLQVRYRIRTNANNATYPLIVNFYRAAGQSPQGESFVGSAIYGAKAANSWQTVSFPPANPLQLGQYIVGTATDSAGNTSEFSPQAVSVGSAEDEIFSDRFQN